MVRAKILPMLIVVVIVLPFFFYLPPSKAATVDQLIKINPENVLEHVWRISAFGSRITGYEGSIKTRDYIVDQIRTYVDNIIIQSFNVTVPYDYGSSVTISGPNTEITVKAYALAPNLIETCYTSGLEGKLVYIKSTYGDLRDFEGTDVAGKIVVLDFDSGEAWRWAVYLGAKGIIFVLDKGKLYTYVEDLTKRFWLPVDLPRVAVYEDDIAPVLDKLRRGEGDFKAVIKVGMKLEVRTGYNVLALIEGSDPNLKDEIVAAFTYYDSWSIIPELNPGQDEAVNIGILIELVKKLAETKPLRTVLIGFFSGHHQALSGARSFIYDAIYRNETLKDILNRLRIVTEISASAYGSKIGIYDQGHFHASVSASTPISYSNNFIKLRTGWDTGKPTEYPGIWNVLRDVVIQLVGEREAEQVLYFDEYNPLTSPLDSIRYFEFEAFDLLQILSYSIGTVSLSPYRNTPSDVVEGTVEEKENISLVANAYANTLNSLLQYKYELPFSEHDFKENDIRILVGRTLIYNMTKGTYEPLPRTTVVLMFFQGVLLQQPLGPYIRHYIIVTSDDKGEFMVPVVVPGGAYTPLAYKDDPSEGPVDYVVDFGEYGTVRETIAVSPQPETYAEISLFPAGSLVVFDVIDPETFSPTDEMGILIIDHYSQNFARFFSMLPEFVAFIPHPNYITGVVQIFVNPELANTPRFDVIFSLGGTRWYSLILTNKNRGFYVEPPEQVILNMTVLKAVINYEIVNYERFPKAKNTKLFVDVAERFLESAEEHFMSAKEFLREKRYYEARGRALMAFALQRQAYINLRLLIFDASYSSVFFLLLSLPFAFLFERLLFEFEDTRKRVVTVLVIFATISLFMYYNHPGFAMLTNVPLIAIGFIMMILTIFPLIVTLSHAGSALKELRIKFIGKHYAEIDKFSALFLSTSLGIRNLRRRKLRTTLVILSVTVSTMAFVSMISLFSATHVAVLSHYEMDSGYQGILIRQTIPSRFLPPLLAEQLKSIYRNDLEAVLPFYVYYPLGERVPIKINITTHEIIGPIAIIGLNPEDFKYLPGLSDEELLSEMIEKGPGPLFLTSENPVCIVPETLAKQLGVEIGDELNILGIRVTVVGIFRDKAEKMYLEYVKDLDNFPIISLAREQEAGGRITIRALNPASPTEVIIMPSGLVKKLGGGVFGIRLVVKNPERGKQIAEELAALFNYYIYYAEKTPEGKYHVRQYASVSTQQVVGQEAVMPAIILLSTILSSILGAVHERKREIGILSSVGLSPLHVAGVFLMEFIIVAIVSSFIGYMLGISIPTVVNIFLPPGEQLAINAGSLWVVLAVALAIGVTIAATIYPVHYASKLVTPSLERKWKLEAQSIRRGDTFIVNLPFVIKKEEIDGALQYIMEYLNIFRGEEGPFMIEDIDYEEKDTAEGRLKSINMRIKVKPFDWNVVMTSQLQVNVTEKTSTWSLIATRLSGTEHIWIRGVRKLTDIVRKQLLFWRSLSPSEREEYIKKALRRREKVQ